MAAIDTLKDIARATRVPPEQAEAALRRIRELVGTAPPPRASAPEARESTAGSDRRYRGGRTRSAEPSSESADE